MYCYFEPLICKNLILQDKRAVFEWVAGSKSSENSKRKCDRRNRFVNKKNVINHKFSILCSLGFWEYLKKREYFRNGPKCKIYMNFLNIFSKNYATLRKNWPCWYQFLLVHFERRGSPKDQHTGFICFLQFKK